MIPNLIYNVVFFALVIFFLREEFTLLLEPWRTMAVVLLAIILRIIDYQLAAYLRMKK